MSRERPILFSGPMVRAILAGRKTMTRRVVKPQPPEDVAPIKVERFYPGVIDRSGDLVEGPEVFGAYDTEGEWGCACPYGEPGDRLWVRETWREVMAPEGQGTEILFRADEDRPGTWRPSIFLPRKHSRLTLEVTAVRVERIQDITAKDIIAEGAVERGHTIEGLDGPNPVSAFDGKCYAAGLRHLWQSGWDAINAKRGYPWSSNPWVWAVAFQPHPRKEERRS